jgi:hypothetical protein
VVEALARGRSPGAWSKPWRVVEALARGRSPGAWSKKKARNLCRFRASMFALLFFFFFKEVLTVQRIKFGLDSVMLH